MHDFVANKLSQTSLLKTNLTLHHKIYISTSNLQFLVCPLAPNIDAILADFRRVLRKF